MGSKSTIAFIASGLMNCDLNGARVLEIGSYDDLELTSNLIKQYPIGEYIGTDVRKGPGVDKVVQAEDLLREFQSEEFDLVVSMEALEHIKGWRDAIHNIKSLLRPGGQVILTTRSFGYHVHFYPYDFWRYEIDLHHHRTGPP